MHSKVSFVCSFRPSSTCCFVFNSSLWAVVCKCRDETASNFENCGILSQRFLWGTMTKIFLKPSEDVLFTRKSEKTKIRYFFELWKVTLTTTIILAHFVTPRNLCRSCINENSVIFWLMKTDNLFKMCSRSFNEWSKIYLQNWQRYNLSHKQKAFLGMCAITLELAVIHSEFLK